MLIVFAVAARAFLTTLIESLGLKAERPWVDDLEYELVEVLAVGRPARWKTLDAQTQTLNGPEGQLIEISEVPLAPEFSSFSRDGVEPLVLVLDGL